MKKIALMILSVLLWVLEVPAQGVSYSAMTVPGDPAMQITNLRDVPIEAYVVSVDMDGTGRLINRIYYDIYIDYSQGLGPTIPGNGSKRVDIPHDTGSNALPPSTAQAVLFTDGSSEGDAPWVNEMLRRRQILLDRLLEVRALMQTISTEGLSRADAINNLQLAWLGRMETIPTRQPGTIDVQLDQERHLHGSVFHLAVGTLKPISPEDMTTPLPPSLLQTVIQRFDAWIEDLQQARRVPATY